MCVVWAVRGALSARYSECSRQHMYSHQREILNILIIGSFFLNIYNKTFKFIKRNIFFCLPDLICKYI